MSIRRCRVGSHPLPPMMMTRTKKTKRTRRTRTGTKNRRSSENPTNSPSAPQLSPYPRESNDTPREKAFFVAVLADANARLGPM